MTGKETVREELIDKVKKELLGPGSEEFSENLEEEIIWEKPSKRYSTGILYPQEIVHEGDKEIENSIEVDDRVEDEVNFESKENARDEELDFDINNDEAITLTNQFKPSSMGMTFFVKGNVKKISISYSYGKYRKAKRDEIKLSMSDEDILEVRKVMGNNFFVIENNTLSLIQDLESEDIRVAKDKLRNLDDRKLKSKLFRVIDYKYAYKRIPVLDNQIIDFSDGGRSKSYCPNNDIRIFAKRKFFKDTDRTSFTIVMINQSTIKKESEHIFQPELKCGSENNSCELIEYTSNPSLRYSLTSEEENLELLYRNKNKYGIGHGTSVQYIKSKASWEVKTSYFPVHEVESMNFELDRIPESVLSMENLSSISKLNKEEIINNLNKLEKAYGKWLLEQEDISKYLNEKYEKSAKDNLNKARKTCERIKKGIELLNENESVFQAFKDANLAMLMQRVQSVNREKNVFPEDKKEVIVDFHDTDIRISKWRGFQLAFFLMSIESIVDEKSEDRDIVDLIWVPTGGGKTEAYLALTAFTIFYRRLRNLDESEGTAVIMRYTLRLLASQQFIRATSMICACELIRQNNIDLYGNEEISIGLWIGSSVTPNTIKKAQVDYDKLIEKKSYSNITNHYNFQLLECPWCGTKMVIEKVNNKWKGQFGLRVNKRKIVHHCTNPKCNFAKQLPVKVIDEAIYNKPPTLLFATVDKFASLPWNGDISSIFGGKNNASPELIIQDELHLISGPLGTIVGLYETVIDYLCSQNGIKPKIVASTATIRNAEEQVKNLYDRNVSQFPPAVLDIDDSYFIKTNKVNNKFGRKYVGIMGSGKTQTTVEIRLIGKVLQSIKNIECDDSERDAYWTLVSYFNSIRELGKCTTLINDDIKDFMRRLGSRTGEQLRYIYKADELTSRVSSSEILKTLDKLEKTYRSDNKVKSIFTSDIVLATNMISVGVDVSRLNSMVVIGQPKLTAEYIQATSRVGRRDPGIVFTLYDSAKTRDRSHYENFKSYHDSFYYYVEPTSLTPFSDAAADRAIHALIISLMRHHFGYNDNLSPSQFTINDNCVEEIKAIIMKRVRNIDLEASISIERKIDTFFQFLESKVNQLSENEILEYCSKGPKDNNETLMKDFGKDMGKTAYETLRAMRSVDVETRVHLRRPNDEN